MKRLLITTIAVVVTISVAVGIAEASYKLGTEVRLTQTSSITDKPLLELVNNVRAEHGVPPLADDPTLDNTAKIKAEDMSALNYWAHDRPNGESWTINIRRSRPYGKIGENLAEGQSDNATTVSAWEVSPEHLKNMIDPDFTKFGSYIAWDEDKYATIRVTHFSD